MDDALVQAFFLHYGVNVWVLILVLMDDALVHHYGRWYMPRMWRVLILVLMDDALVLH